MIVIGITGGVGAGKTQVLSYIEAHYRCRVIRADEAAHLLEQRGKPCYERLIGLLGEAILDKDKNIDRQKMAEAIFKNKNLLEQVNAIIHPEVKKYILQEIDYERKKGEADFFFIEAALLIEERYDLIADELWYIHADKHVRRQRLMRDRHYSAQKADSIMEKQLSEAEFRKHCRRSITNNGNIEETYRQIRDLMEGCKMEQLQISGQELVFGLDIGTRNVVGTVGYKQDERFVVVAQEIRQHQTRAMLDGQIHDINRVARTIADIREAIEAKTNLKFDEVCIAAAGRMLRTMNLHIDMDLDKERNVTKEDMSTLVSLGIEKAFQEFHENNDTDIHFYCVGYSVVKYYLNGMWMGQPEHHKAKNIGADMIATFLPDDVVDGLYSAVELAGLKVSNLTLEPIAAIRVAIPERFRLLNIAMIDVGAGTSDISITDDGSIVAFGMLPHAGDSLTEILARTCLIDFATAEMIKTAATQQDEITYEDIMGIEQKISAKKVVEICRPEIEKMAKITAQTIKELNGGNSPSAVFVVGGGGKITGFCEVIASELGLDPSRVALRGEEILRDVDFPEGSLKDSTIITPIGICLSYFDQNNSFIHVTFNGSRMKLYDNNKLAVVDAAMQASFNKDGLFPRRGKELHYTVNGKNRVTKGEYGESAHIYLNGEAVNMNHSIKANDEIVIEESTIGKEAQEHISDLVDFNGRITLTINSKEMQLPKPVTVNGNTENEDYLIKDGDTITIGSSYTYKGLVEYMGYAVDDALVTVNGEEADESTIINNNDTVVINSKKEIELKNIYKAAEEARAAEAAKAAEEARIAEEEARRAAEEEAKRAEEKAKAFEKSDNEKTEATEETSTSEENDKAAEKETRAEETTEASAAEAAPDVNESLAENAEDKTKSSDSEKENAGEEKQASPQDVKKESTAKTTKSEKAEKQKAPEPKETESGAKKIIVIVNNEPIVMKGRNTYAFVDIFDYIDFDTKNPPQRGSSIVTTVNGRDAQYTQELFNGDKIEVYWKEYHGRG